MQTQLSAQTEAQLVVMTEDAGTAKTGTQHLQSQITNLTSDVGRLSSELVHKEAEIAALKDQLRGFAQRGDDLERTEAAAELAKSTLVEKCAEFDRFKEHAQLQIKVLPANFWSLPCLWYARLV